jgi:hypothetical protein
MQSLADCDVIEDDDTDVGASAHSTAPPQPAPRGSRLKRILTLVSMTALAAGALLVHARVPSSNHASAALSVSAPAVASEQRAMESQAPSDHVAAALAAKAGSDPKKAKTQSAKKGSPKREAKARPAEKAKPNNKTKATANAKPTKPAAKTAAAQSAKKRNPT